MTFGKDIITSRKNAAVTEAAALADKKYRDKTGLFAFEGIKLFEDASAANVEIIHVFVTEIALSRWKRIFCSAGIVDKIVPVTEDVYGKLTSENAPQGVFTVAKKPIPAEKAYGDNAFVMILDSLADPGNLGTVIRSAEAFGVDTVFVGAGSADIYGPKTVRASMGSVFRVDIRACEDTEKEIKSLEREGFRIYAAMLDNDAESILSIKLSSGRLGFVVGNEGHGVSENIKNACTGSVIIPMSEGPQSLNAANSASILAWEVFKSRKQKRS